MPSNFELCDRTALRSTAGHTCETGEVLSRGNCGESLSSTVPRKAAAWNISAGGATTRDGGSDGSTAEALREVAIRPTTDGSIGCIGRHCAIGTAHSPPHSIRRKLKDHHARQF